MKAIAHKNIHSMDRSEILAYQLFMSSVMRAKFKERKRMFRIKQNMWAYSPILLCAVVVALIFINLVKIVTALLMIFLIGCALFTFIHPLFRSSLMELLRKIFGKSVLGMKVDALAKHLKVSFTYVPEHYECEKAVDNK